jgi:ATP-dependent DNA ligase
MDYTLGQNEMEMPRLFKLSTTGKLLQWDIRVDWALGEFMSFHQPAIVTVHGQEDGKMQEAMDIIKSGKNAGRKNETSAVQQAIFEAKAKWQKQLDKGYVEDRERALRGESDVVVKPMLAQSFEKHSAKIKYPCYGQAKLDGTRCLAIIDFDAKSVNLFSRSGKPITSMTHIQDELTIGLIEGGFQVSGQVILDGELYNHDLKDNFEKLISLIRKETPQGDYKDIQFHIYDVIDTKLSQESRNFFLQKMWDFIGADGLGTTYLKKIVGLLIPNEARAETALNEFLDLGYEGLMLRNKEGLYANKRSYDLQKFKKFDDAEFKIVGVEEGRGKLRGHAAAMVCETSDGTKFKAKLDGCTGYLKDLLEDDSLWEGKSLTVKYQGLTGKNQVPRFPVGKAIRDYE